CCEAYEFSARMPNDGIVLNTGAKQHVLHVGNFTIARWQVRRMQPEKGAGGGKAVIVDSRHRVLAQCAQFQPFFSVRTRSAARRPAVGSGWAPLQQLSGDPNMKDLLSRVESLERQVKTWRCVVAVLSSGVVVVGIVGAAQNVVRDQVVGSRFVLRSDRKDF